MRSRASRSARPPDEFRRALEAIAPTERDAWLDCTLGLTELPADGPLPRGCVPYLPCAVATMLELIDHAAIGPDDVFVDVGAGVGRALTFVHLCTGAEAIGLELQPALAAQARALAERLDLARVRTLEGDAADLVAHVTTGTVFLLYCPFGGERLQRTLAALRAHASRRPIRVGCIDLPLPPCDWLRPAVTPSPELTIHRSTSP